MRLCIVLECCNKSTTNSIVIDLCVFMLHTDAAEGARIGFCPIESVKKKKNRRDVVATPVSYPFRWLRLSVKHRFFPPFSSFQEVRQRSLVFDTSLVSLAADSFPSRGSHWMARSSSLPLEGKVAERSEVRRGVDES